MTTGQSHRVTHNNTCINNKHNRQFAPERNTNLKQNNDSDEKLSQYVTCYFTSHFTLGSFYIPVILFQMFSICKTSIEKNWKWLFLSVRPCVEVCVYLLQSLAEVQASAAQENLTFVFLLTC